MAVRLRVRRRPRDPASVRLVPGGRAWSDTSAATSVVYHPAVAVDAVEIAAAGSAPRARSAAPAAPRGEDTRRSLCLGQDVGDQARDASSSPACHFLHCQTLLVYETCAETLQVSAQLPSSRQWLPERSLTGTRPLPKPCRRGSVCSRALAGRDRLPQCEMSATRAAGAPAACGASFRARSRAAHRSSS
jgi:hypothetical protein